MADLTWQDEPNTELVRDLLLAASAEDGRPEVAASGPLPREFRGGRHLVLPSADGTRLDGYAHLDTAGDSFGRQVAEVVVRPSERRRGLGAALVAAVADAAPPDTRFWSHGGHPGAFRIAERRGYATVREMWQMRRPLGPGADPLPAAPEPPEGVSVRAFVPGSDEEAVVAVNKRAFDWHPEQGALTADDIRATEREAWFDPAGFFLAERDGAVIGFHWTKVHPDGVGEVYVVGVDPAAQGGGLGKILTLVGMGHLQDLGLPAVMLYVEADNVPAVKVYHRLGFARSDRDVQFALALPEHD